MLFSYKPNLLLATDYNILYQIHVEGCRKIIWNLGGGGGSKGLGAKSQETLKCIHYINIKFNHHSIIIWLSSYSWLNPTTDALQHKWLDS